MSNPNRIAMFLWKSGEGPFNVKKSHQKKPGDVSPGFFYGLLIYKSYVKIKLEECYEKSSISAFHTSYALIAIKAAPKL